MRWIVNVENLNFEDLIPLLKKNKHMINKSIGLSDSEVEEIIFTPLEFLLKKLKSGIVAEDYLLATIFCECLGELNRVLITADYACEDDYDIVPITKVTLQNFLNII